MTLKTANVAETRISLKFNAAEQPDLHSSIGPMVQTGAPYSANGFAVLSSLSHLILPGWSEELEPFPDQFASCQRWQYGTGSHANPSRLILGTVLTSAHTPPGIILRIHHLVLYG